MKRQARATAAASPKIGTPHWNGQLIKLLNDNQSIILLRVYQLHLGVIII